MIMQVTYARTYNLGNYENVRLEAIAVTTENDAPAAFAEARAAVEDEYARVTGKRQPPRDADDAEQRFFARYGSIVGGDAWLAVQRFLSSRAPKPTTIEGWIAAAEAVRDKQRQAPPVPAADVFPIGDPNLRD